MTVLGYIAAMSQTAEVVTVTNKKFWGHCPDAETRFGSDCVGQERWDLCVGPGGGTLNKPRGLRFVSSVSVVVVDSTTTNRMRGIQRAFELTQ